MPEENERNPQWKPNSIPLGEKVVIKLDSATDIANGENRFGPWYMWMAIIKNQTVIEGRGQDSKDIENYTGKAIFFPGDTMHKELLSITGGTETGIELEITRNALESSSGRVYTKYEMRRVLTNSFDGFETSSNLLKEKFMKQKEGEAPSVSGLSKVEQKLLDNVKGLIDEGITPSVDEKSFIEFAADTEYKIEEARAKELYKVFEGLVK